MPVLGFASFSFLLVSLSALCDFALLCFFCLSCRALAPAPVSAETGKRFFPASALKLDSWTGFSSNFRAQGVHTCTFACLQFRLAANGSLALADCLVSPLACKSLFHLFAVHCLYCLFLLSILFWCISPCIPPITHSPSYFARHYHSGLFDSFPTSFSLSSHVLALPAKILLFLFSFRWWSIFLEALKS